MREIAKQRTKTIVLYPFALTPSNFTVNLETLSECMSKKRILDNHIEVSSRGAVHVYSVIVDSTLGDFVAGRFVKLKTDNIETIDKRTFEEDLAIIGVDKYIEENAYFIWNLRTNILLAQFNLDSLNVLTGNSNKVLKKALSECGLLHNIEIAPFPSKEFIQNIIENKGTIYKYNLSFSELSKPYLEEMGMQSDLIWEIAENQGVELGIFIKLSHHQTLTESLYSKLKNLVSRILPGAKRFVVYTDEGNFDLIGDKAIYYSETVLIYDDLDLYRQEIYNVIRKKLMAETSNLLEIRKKMEKNQTLDQF